MPPLPRSVPYPWPRDAREGESLTSERVALVVIAVQQSYIATTLDAEAVAFRIGLAARALRQAGAFVIRVMVAQAGVSAVPVPVPDELDKDPCADAVITLVERYADFTLVAAHLDAFRDTDLDAHLRRLGRDRVALCGLGAESSVDQTRTSASRLGYECLTLVDAVAPHSRAHAAAAHSEVMRSGGALGAIGRTTDLVAALTG